MFKQIEGYDYLISDDGLVMNSRGRILKPRINNKGYHQICLFKNNKGKNYSVHRLVAQAFIQNPNNYPEVDHIDNNKSNNSVENLRWITSSGNQRNKVGRGKYLTGVHKRGNKYRGRISIDGKYIHLGYFDTEQEAHQAYLNKYNELMNKF